MNRTKEIQALAQSRGFKCLSTAYQRASARLTWECPFGHRWNAVLRSIKSIGTGCPRCAGRGATIEDMRDRARFHEGECLSEAYVDALTKLLWKCKFGHEFMARPNNVRQGQWCPVCANKVPKTVEDMHRLAARMNGEFLSPAYLGCSTQLEWKCEAGHRFMMVPKAVREGHWCRYCYIERTRQRHRKNRLKKLSEEQETPRPVRKAA